MNSAIATNLFSFFLLSRQRTAACYHAWSEINKRGIITITGIVCVVVAVSIYLSALYGAFEASFLLRRQAEEIKQLTERAVALEINLQKRQADFRLANIPELETMEKISSIKYIGNEPQTAFFSR